MLGSLLDIRERRSALVVGNARDLVGTRVVEFPAAMVMPALSDVLEPVSV